MSYFNKKHVQMKKNIVLLFFSLLTFSLFANGSSPFQPEQKKAADLYKKGQYEQAITVYENILPKDKESAQVYYNLGNAYYKSGQTARAILNYERALLVKPNYEDARFNLEMAKAKTPDKINNVGDLFFVEWIKSIANFMSSNVWAVLSITLFIISLVLFFVYAFMHQVGVRKFGFYGAIIGLLLSAFTFSMSYAQKNKAVNKEYAIVMAPSVTVTSTPDEQGTKLFVIHEGIKVKIKSSLDMWVEIQLSDGNVGWIKADDVEKI